VKTKPLNSEIFRSRASHELEILCGLDGKLHIVAVGPGRAVDHDFPARARCPFLRGIPLILQIEPLSSLPRADIRPLRHFEDWAACWNKARWSLFLLLLLTGNVLVATLAWIIVRLVTG
jgi:hypothetical protein